MGKVSDAVKILLDSEEVLSPEAVDSVAPFADPVPAWDQSGECTYG